jgi:hypothetical protein
MRTILRRQIAPTAAGTRFLPRTSVGKSGSIRAHCWSDPGSSTPAPESKSLLVLFFRKEQNLLFLKKKKQKDF